jgi:hypothetical protein
MVGGYYVLIHSLYLNKIQYSFTLFHFSDWEMDAFQHFGEQLEGICEWIPVPTETHECMIFMIII